MSMKGNLMNKSGLILAAAAFICCSGFFKKSDDGSYSVDTSGIEKQANDAAASANAEIDKASKQAEEYSAKAIEKIKSEAAKLDVPKEEILADLKKPLEEIQAKATAMDPAKLTAYLNQYSHVFADTQAQVADYTQQVKDLNWTEKMSSKGKELKAQLEQYTSQFSSLKEQADLYMNTLSGFGLDPAALGIDLSEYGL